MPNRPWSDSEVNLLKSQVGKKNIKIPTRSSKSIRRKLISLGLVKPKFKITKHKKTKWTGEEIKSLQAGSKSIEGKSKDAVRSMMIRLGLKGPTRSYRPPWKKKDESLLKSLIRQGKTPKTIFDMKVFQHSRNSIQKKMGSMGLSRKSPKSTKLSYDEKVFLRKFLDENWEGKTPDDLVLLWNQKGRFKVNKSKIVYYLKEMGIKISYGEVSRINHQRKKEQEIKQKPHRSLKDLEEEIRQSRIKMMRQRLSQGRDIWSGMESEEAKEELVL